MMTTTDPLEDDELLLELVRALVREPAAVKIHQKTQPGLSEFDIEVAFEDRALIIGKQGSTINAIRRLFGKIGHLDGQRIMVHLIEHKSDKQPRRQSGTRQPRRRAGGGKKHEQAQQKASS